MEKKATIKISKETWDHMRALEGIEDLEALDDDQLDDLNARQDDSSYSFVFEFDNGTRITFALSSGSTNYWWDMWFDDDYDYPEVVEEFAQSMEVDGPDGETYICEFEIE